MSSSQSFDYPSTHAVLPFYAHFYVPPPSASTYAVNRIYRSFVFVTVAEIVVWEHHRRRPWRTMPTTNDRVGCECPVAGRVDAVTCSFIAVIISHCTRRRVHRDRLICPIGTWCVVCVNGWALKWTGDKLRVVATRFGGTNRKFLKWLFSFDGYWRLVGELLES